MTSNVGSQRARARRGCLVAAMLAVLPVACGGGELRPGDQRGDVAHMVATVAALVAEAIALPPVDAPFDYQLGGDYRPAAGVVVVTRDWFVGTPLDDGYSICYVNAFQTQPDDQGRRPDETARWPAAVVLDELGDDPNWPGEFLIDVSTDDRRRIAAQHVAAMVDECARKGFDAVEFDNLDSWTRFDDGGPTLPFGQAEAVEFGAMITTHAHSRGLAVGQKNTPQLTEEQSRTIIGFDFAVSEECGAYDECDDYTAIFGDNVLVIEYTDEGFARACAAVGDRVSVVRRDLDLAASDHSAYRFDRC